MRDRRSQPREDAPGRRSGTGASSVLQHLERDAKRRGAPAAETVQPTVLVVDDVDAGRYATARMLRAAGFRTIEAPGGAAALARAPSASAVVLDVHLPDIHGLEVCRLLRANPATRHLPIVQVSAVYTTEADRDAGALSGADAYLLSPVDPDELVGTLLTLLARAAAR
jgi:CheY-like chemotaxis protein